MNKIALIFIGPPGCGKGTQAQLLGKKYQIPIISSGELYRDIISKNNSLANKVKEFVASGSLVPDRLHVEMVKAEIFKTKSAVLILDGVIRNALQKKYIEKILIDADYKKIYVVYIDLPDSEAKKRMALRRRADDQSSVINNRFIKYHQETDPLIALYRTENNLIEINGLPKIPAVLQEILSKLRNILPND